MTTEKGKGMTIMEDDVVVVNEIMTPNEVAEIFRVDQKTVARWAIDEKIETTFRTPGGHRRYKAEQFKKWIPNLKILKGKGPRNTK